MLWYNHTSSQMSLLILTGFSGERCGPSASCELFEENVCHWECMQCLNLFSCVSVCSDWHAWFPEEGVGRGKGSHPLARGGVPKRKQVGSCPHPILFPHSLHLPTTTTMSQHRGHTLYWYLWYYLRGPSNTDVKQHWDRSWVKHSAFYW